MRSTLSPSVVNDAAAGEPDAVRDYPRRNASAARQSVAAGDEVLRHIWLTIRLPRVLLALLVGAALALSGCVMQGLFRNPLADPGLLGSAAVQRWRWPAGWFCRCPFRRWWRCMLPCWRRLSAVSQSWWSFYPQPGE